MALRQSQKVMYGRYHKQPNNIDNQDQTTTVLSRFSFQKVTKNENYFSFSAFDSSSSQVKSGVMSEIMVDCVD